MRIGPAAGGPAAGGLAAGGLAAGGQVTSGGARTRFAPSPTGLLHLGHVHAACVARAAAGAGGYLVRIEDIDAQRCRAAYAQAILEDLAWLGLGSDEPVRVQSAHLDEYAAALAGLAARGLVYPCFCSRADVARELAASASAPHGLASHGATLGATLGATPGGGLGASLTGAPVGAAVHAAAGAARPAHGLARPGPDGAPVYPGTCRRLAAEEVAARLARGEAHAWRLNMTAALAAVPRGAPALRFFEHGQGWITAEPGGFGDVVLGRRDAPASYHLCVTHDDGVQGVSLVTRGEDLRPATHLHVLLQQLMGLPTPHYAHHQLLRGADGARLSKRDGAASVRALRAAGLSAAEVIARASPC